MSYTTSRIYRGLLSLETHYDEVAEIEVDDILFLSSVACPLAEELEWMKNKKVTVRYWVSDQPCTQDEAIESAAKIAMGIAAAQFKVTYSELSDLLFVDEDLNIGGHDLMAELKSSAGKWLIMEIWEHEST